jgi:hypothetical protein
VNEWLSQAADRLAESSGVERAELELPPAEVAALLDDAGFAAHTSGQRTNAPLLCFLLGVCAGRGADLAVLHAALRAGQPPSINPDS